MFFFNPAVLIALASVLVPLILHFLYRRRKEHIEFSSLYFIKKVEASRRIKSSWLEYILLLLRMLILSSIVLAFSKPIATYGTFLSTPEKKTYFISFYNGAHLNVRYLNGTIRSKMIESVSDWLKTCGRNDVFILINPRTGKEEVLKKDEIVAGLTDIEPDNRTKIDIQQYLKVMKEHVANSNIINYEGIFFSPIKVDKFFQNVGFFYYLETIETIENKAITSVRIKQKSLAPNTNLTLEVNFNELINEASRYVVVIKGQTVYEGIADSVNKVNVPIGKYKSGDYTGYVQLASEDNYLADNSYYFSFSVGQKQAALILYEGENSILKKLFSAFPDSLIQISLDATRNLARYNLSHYQTVVYEGNIGRLSLGEQLFGYIKRAFGTVVFIPSVQMDQATWNASSLGKYLSYRGTLGDINSEVAFRLMPQTVRTDILPNFYEFQKQSTLPILFKFAYRIKKQGFEALIGNRDKAILRYNQTYKIYSFLVPFDERATMFIYDSRFVPIMYGILFSQNKKVRVDLKKSELVVSSEYAPSILYLKGKKYYQLLRKRREMGQAVYKLPLQIDEGVYQGKLNNKEIQIPVNKSVLDIHILYPHREYVKPNTSEKKGRYNYTHFFLIFALLLYVIEIWLGRRKVFA